MLEDGVGVGYNNRLSLEKQFLIPEDFTANQDSGVIPTENFTNSDLEPRHYSSDVTKRPLGAISFESTGTGEVHIRLEDGTVGVIAGSHRPAGDGFLIHDTSSGILSTSGDINNDGFNDLVVSNTGSFDSPSGYSAVEIFYGNSNGFSIECDKSFQSNLQGTLFGYEVEIVSDINGDGVDDIFISEPYNSSNAYQSGMIWIFYGNSTDIANQPDMVITGQINQLIGVNIISAGDTNSDGYNDVLITHSGSQVTGTVELYLGCLLYTSPSPRDRTRSRMPSSA